jgi:hypothetical protein
VQRWEGLVLKGCHDPYPSFCRDTGRVELNIYYIPGLGDTADVVILEIIYRTPAHTGCSPKLVRSTVLINES